MEGCYGEMRTMAPRKRKGSLQCQNPWVIAGDGRAKETSEKPVSSENASNIEMKPS